MRRPLTPYIEILEGLVSGRITPLEFRTRTIEQFGRIDAGVHWSREWGQGVADALDQMDGDAEVYYPECPEESYITFEELQQSCRENLRRLQEAQRKCGPATDDGS